MGSHARATIEGASAAKPMASPIYWALLGLVIERPSHVYELAQRFERAFGHALSLSSETYAYKALDELERRGFVEEALDTPRLRSGTSRQPKVPYQATAEGRRCFRERMLAQTSEDRRHAQVFVRQLAAFEHEPDVALEILDRYEKECLREAVQVPRESGRLADRLLAEESRWAMEGRMPWVEYARGVFRDLQAAGGDDVA